MIRVASFALLAASVAGLSIFGAERAQHAQYEQLVSKLIDDIRQPAEEYKQISNNSKYLGLTMQSRENLYKFKLLIETIVDQNLSGDIYETGSWRGGTGIFMVSVFQAYEKLKGKADLGRQYYFFDSFGGFPKTTNDAPLDRYLSDPIYAAPLSLVKESFRRYGVLLPGRVNFVQGFFEDTVPKLTETRQIALLRMDGDLYSSTKVVLDHLYPRVQAQGWVFVDDYTWRPEMTANNTKLCREAIDEYRSAHGITARLTGAYGKASWQKDGVERHGQ